MSRQLPSEPGWEVRYNAAATLARGANVPWPIARCSTNNSTRNHGVRLPDGKYVYDEVAAREFTIVALKAIATWHEKQPAGARTEQPALLEVYARVDELAQSPHVALKTQAEKTRSVFFR